jgi:hypothetical protein
MKLVSREVSSIRARDGVLPKTPYLWAEVHTRLATLKPWDGMRAGDTIGRALRPLVEAAVIHVKATSSQDEPLSPQHMPPLQAAQALGTKKHRHLKGTAHGRQLQSAS